jgi:hypothetical protein
VLPLDTRKSYPVESTDLDTPLSGDEPDCSASDVLILNPKDRDSKVTHNT